MDVSVRIDRFFKPVEEVDETEFEDQPFNTATYREAIKILDVRIRELEIERNKPLKSRVFAYLATGVWTPTSLAVLAYQAFLDAGWSSDDRNFHLASIVTMVGMLALSSATLASWQCFGVSVKKKNQVDKTLQEKKKYKQFRVAAVSFFQNPSFSLFNLLTQTYQALPVETQVLHQEEMAKARGFFVPDGS